MFVIRKELCLYKVITTYIIFYNLNKWEDVNRNFNLTIISRCLRFSKKNKQTFCLSFCKPFVRLVGFVVDGYTLYIFQHFYYFSKVSLMSHENPMSSAETSWNSNFYPSKGLKKNWTHPIELLNFSNVREHKKIINFYMYKGV